MSCDDHVVSFYTANPNGTHWNRQFQKNYSMTESNRSRYLEEFDYCFFETTNSEFMSDTARFDGQLSPFFIIDNITAALNSMFIVHDVDQSVQLEFNIYYNSMLSSGTTTTK